MEKVTLNVTDMHCPNCAMTLQALEDDLPGVKSIDASYHRQKMTVCFDESLITLEQICDAVKQAGYTAETQKS